jgi:hypothetical protein
MGANKNCVPFFPPNDELSIFLSRDSRMNDPRLCELLENITTSEQLAEFIGVLCEDFICHPENWQNINLKA